MADLTDRFGTMVFSEEVMKDYLPKDIWKRLAATLEGGEPLDLDVANAVAHALFGDTNRKCFAIGISYNRAVNLGWGYKDWYLMRNTS